MRCFKCEKKKTVFLLHHDEIGTLVSFQGRKGLYRVKLVAELNQTPQEEEVVPHVVQLISPPFLGRTVLTAGPAKFGMDLTKQEHGVSCRRDGKKTKQKNTINGGDDVKSCSAGEGQHREGVPLHGLWVHRQRRTS